jgi:hypothetical protein
VVEVKENDQELTKEDELTDADDEDDEVIDVKMFTHDGKEYLKDVSTNMLYDTQTQDLVGVYNAESDTITPCEDAACEDDDDEEN